MVTITQSAHDRLVREVAERYIRQGYPVQVEPLDEDLPDFLAGYHPDLVVTTPEGRMVVEVKSTRQARGLDYWQRLKEAIDTHPGWSLHIVLNNKREEELLGAEMPVLSEAEVKARLTASEQLADNGMLDSALVVAWSTLEAVLRAQSRAEGLFLPNQGPGALMTALYTEGGLGTEDYEALTRILSARNQAAHGFRIDNMDRSVVDQIQNITSRLLGQSGRRPKSGAH
jgi:hypothetical protein